ncbi:MAG: thermonuclease family protein [Reyranellaceae bacterium]
MGRVAPFRRRREQLWRPSLARRQRAARTRSPFVTLYLMVAVSGLVWLGYDYLIEVKTRVAATLGADTVAVCGRFAGATCVIDGDTIEHRGERIRLAGINTPEIVDYKCEGELRLGLQARERLVELLNQGPFEIVAASGRPRDVYGRLLADIERDGLSLGGQLIAEGLAHPWSGYRRSWCG